MSKTELVIEIDGQWDAHKKRDVIESFDSFLKSKSLSILTGGMKNIIYHQNKKGSGGWLIEACSKVFEEINQNVRDNYPAHKGLIVINYPFDSEKMIIKLNTTLPKEVRKMGTEKFLDVFKKSKTGMGSKMVYGYLNFRYGKDIIKKAEEISLNEGAESFLQDIEKKWSLMIIMEFNNRAIQWFKDNNFNDFKIKIINGPQVSTIHGHELMGYENSKIETKQKPESNIKNNIKM